MISDERLGLEYELTSIGGLVQACGELRGKEIYFRAKYNNWSFDVANEEGMLPSDGGQGGYYRESKYKDAGNMSMKEAEEIIKDCVNDYMRTNTRKRGH